VHIIRETPPNNKLLPGKSMMNDLDPFGLVKNDFQQDDFKTRMMDNFPKDIILTRAKPPFSFRRRGRGMIVLRE
jgi:hypothetical protein